MGSLSFGAAVQAADTAVKSSGPVQIVAVVIICCLIAFLAWNLICNDDSPPVNGSREDEYNPDHEQWI